MSVVSDFITQTGAHTLDELRTVFSAKNIKVIERDGMFILVKPTSPNYNDPIVVYSDGYIFDKTTLKPVLVPMKLTRPYSKRYTRFDPNLKVYPVLDGTILYFFYNNGSWQIKSAKCFNTDQQDIKNQLFDTQLSSCGNLTITYRALFDVLIAKKYTEFSYDRLDTNMCYAINLKVDAIHIFGPATDTGSINMLYAYNLQTMQQTSPGYTGLDNVEPITMSKVEFDTIYATCSNTKGSYLQTGKCVFGYIFRSTGDDTYDTILTSDLYLYIKNVLYSEAILDVVFKGYNRWLYTGIRNIVRVYRVHENINGALLRYFPCYTALASRVIQIIDMLRQEFVTTYSSGATEVVYCRDYISKNNPPRNMAGFEAYLLSDEIYIICYSILEREFITE